MRTVKWNPFLSGVCAFLGGMLLWAGAARADITTTNAAAIVVFPKILVETTSPVHKLDTFIQLTNTADHPVNVRCFYVNANGHCSNDPTLICDPNGPAIETFFACHGLAACLAGWQETDFSFRLTSKQPIDWTVSNGLLTLPLNDGPGPKGEFNSGSIPPAPENPMIGELKCIEVGEDEFPVDANDLKGEATIEEVTLTPIAKAPDVVDADIRGYNAIGIQAVEGQNDRNNVLVLGAEYNACPNILVVDHFFDYAIEPATFRSVTTDLTFVPCSEDFNFQFPIPTVVQFLVFNEFEQRFSTSRTIRCLTEIQISDIDTRAGPADDFASIFSVFVQGTLTGQTLARGVGDSDTTHGHGMLAVAEEFHTSMGGDVTSAAFNVHQRGKRTQFDIVLLPEPQPTGP